MRRVSRKTWIVLAVSAFVFVVAACGPGLFPGVKGFPHARAPFYGQVTVAPQPAALGTTNGGAAYWNRAGGRSLFKVTTTSPLITFRAATPLCKVDKGTPARPPCEKDTSRVVAYSLRLAGPDATVSSCIVFFDPTFVAAGIPGRHLNDRVWAHELGHCLDLLGDNNDCTHTSVMSACFFWQHVLGNIPPTRHDTNQLRAAGYIR